MTRATVGRCLIRALLRRGPPGRPGPAGGQSRVTCHPPPRRPAEGGQAVALVALVLPVAILLVGSCVDLARLWAARAALQAAVDAAALAGVDGANGWAELQVRLERVVCAPAPGGGPPSCWREESQKGVAATVSRLKSEGWRAVAGCGGSGWTCIGATVDQTWVSLDDQSSEAAAAIFAQAADRLVASGIAVAPPEVVVDAAGATVQVTARAAVATAFGRFFGRPAVGVGASGTAAARVRTGEVPDLGGCPERRPEPIRRFRGHGGFCPAVSETGADGGIGLATGT